MPTDRVPGNDLDPALLSAHRVVAAAEWVGTLNSHGPRGADVRFAPGGRTHAYDRATGVILCGADVGSLELFWVDFLCENTGFHCEDCLRLAGAQPIDPGVDVEFFRS